MAIDLVPGTDALEYTHFHTGFNPVVSATPLTIFARVKLNGTPGSLGACIIAFERIPPGFGGNYQYFELGIDSARRPFIVTRRGFTVSSATSPTALDIGTWYDIVAVVLSQASRKIYVDQVHKATDLTDVGGDPTSLEGAIIGASYTVTPGTYNHPLAACIQDIAVWRIALTDNEVTDELDPDDPTALHRTDIPLHVPFADAATATVAWDYTSGVSVAVTLTQAGTGGSVTTCNDSPGTPDPVEDDCEGEDEADAAPTPETWPTCDFVPEDIDVQAVSASATPGRAHSGRQQFVQQAAGHWRIELIGIPIWTKTLALQWRALEAKLDGRNGTILVPFYEGKLSSTSITATAAGAYEPGDVRIAITQTAGATIRAGMHFSVSDRGYRIKKRLSDDGDGNAQVVIWPPVRDAIAHGATLNFNTPHVRCRLERDDGMGIMFEHLKYGKHNVAFVEDV